MCRAIWVVIYGARDESAKRLRRAAGADVQVVGMATTTDDLTKLIATTRADVLIVEASAPSAREIVPMLVSADRAVVWIGENPPAEAGASLIQSEDIDDALPSAITKALLSRKR